MIEREIKIWTQSERILNHTGEINTPTLLICMQNEYGSAIDEAREAQTFLFAQ